MKLISSSFLMIWLLCVQTSIADPIVTFFFRNYPTVRLATALSQKFRKPHGIAKQSLNGIINHNSVAGIFSSYFGFLNISDQNGQTVFPRKQSRPVIELVITNKITPIMMFQSTVSHWELVPGTPAQMYRCEFKEDESTKLTFWEVVKEPLPEDNHIPLQDSLIIIAKPTDIIVPTGITLAQPSANLLLPDLYVKKGIQTTRNALYVLNLSFLFRPIDLLYKKSKLDYETLINE